MSGTALADLLRALIVAEGPLTVERFMALALGHPQFGYYATRDPLGVDGDFTTAPEISQMFGELLGLWAVAVWTAMGAPDPVRLVELGPGRGTLMADALRAAGSVSAFRAALDIHMVETSPVLAARQRATLAAGSATATWHTLIGTVPAGPAIFIANEFFDALPVRQYVGTARGWCERLVGLDASGALGFGLLGEPERALPSQAPEGGVVEVGMAALQVMTEIATRIVGQGGALLAIDYGYTAPGFTDTLQAISRHRSVDALATPGEADLTTHVDFSALARSARHAGAVAHGPVGQGVFLQALGIAQRAAMLKRRATPAQSIAIDAAVARLTEPAPGMGDLFKVLAVTSPETPAPPGFSLEFTA